MGVGSIDISEKCHSEERSNEESLGWFDFEPVLWPKIKVVADLFANGSRFLAGISRILHYNALWVVASLLQNDMSRQGELRARFGMTGGGNYSKSTCRYDPTSVYN
jgi:hypothetical protein